MTREEITFITVQGIAVPSQPWPQKFVVTRTLLASEAVEVRPLTLSGLAKGVVQNFVTMSWWRLCWVLRGLGFLATPECGLYRWRDLTWRCWRYQQMRRFKWVSWLTSRTWWR